MKYPEISVIVPCYKEAAIIKNTLSILDNYLSGHFEKYEIIAVTDGSPDETLEKIKDFGTDHKEAPLRLISFGRNQGKGAAVKEGVLAAKYNAILFTDADLAIPIEELETFLPVLEHSDIVIASRLAPGSLLEEATPWYRTLLARGFHALQILLLGNFEFSDTQCGFKLFRKTVAQDLFSQSTIKRFAFDAEILFLAKRFDYSVSILPVTIRRDTRNTNVDILRDPINMFFALLKIRWNSWHGRYESSKK